MRARTKRTWDRASVLEQRAHYLNRRYFHGSLPPVHVFWRPSPGNSGYTIMNDGRIEIWIGPYLKRDERSATLVLIHELAHVLEESAMRKTRRSLDPNRHSRVFHSIMLGLAAEGALNRWW